jgi:hypothetical protein
LPVPFWASLEDDALAYCLESDRDQPKGDDYSVSQAFYNTRTLTGVQAIPAYLYSCRVPLPSSKEVKSILAYSHSILTISRSSPRCPSCRYTSVGRRAGLAAAQGR